MSNRKRLKIIRRNLLIVGIPISIFQWLSIVLWITKGFWWLFVIWILAGVPCAFLVSRYYFSHVAYICPQCRTVFKPLFREALWAKHTPTVRKLTCNCCGYHGFCVEVAREEDEDHE